MKRRLRIAGTFLGPACGAFCWVLSFAVSQEPGESGWTTPLFIAGIFSMMIGQALAVMTGWMRDWPKDADAMAESFVSCP